MRPHDEHHHDDRGNRRHPANRWIHAIRQVMAHGRHGGGHRGHHGHGPEFGGGNGGHGGDEFARGRKFSGEDLQLLLLALIEEQPRHGYELIKALQTRSNGYYSPSPGMVYPALTYLEDLGHVIVEAEGNRKRYSLSTTGRAHLKDNRERVEAMLAKLERIAERMHLVRRAFAGESVDDGGDSGWVPELIKARAAIKHALRSREDAPAKEQRRIAAILRRAVREIEDGDAR